MAQTAQKNSVFETLNAVNVNGHTEDKNGLTYLSWAWAWAEVKKAYPDAIYTIYETDLFDDNNRPFKANYFTDYKTCWVKTGVTINGIEHIEYLPVMDYKNRSIPFANVTSFDINKAIQRSLTKAVARHGLGLYIYAGEDLPESETEAPKEQPKPQTKPKAKEQPKEQPKELPKVAPAVDDKKIKILREKMEQKGVSEQTILKTAQVSKLEEMSIEVFTKIWKKLEATPDKAKTVDAAALGL